MSAPPADPSSHAAFDAGSVGSPADADETPPDPDPDPEIDQRPPPARAGRIPGLGAFGPGIERFDKWADDHLERIRGYRLTDALFNGATRLGDFSMIWHIANLIRGTTGIRRRRQIPVLALTLGVESLIVNQGLKRLFKRKRPTTTGDPRYEVRRPATSSFPSGHSSAAGFMATLLTGWDGKATAALWWPIAVVVATSRAFVRIHHASDVVAGIGVGALLGLIARRVLRRYRLA